MRLAEMCRRKVLWSVAAAAMVATTLAVAQTPPPAAVPPPPGAAPRPPQSPACARLEGQLAAFDRAMSDAVRVDQIKRLEDAANKQQFELDRLLAQSRRAGCEGGGFFVFGGQPPQCGQINAQVQQARSNLDRTQVELERLQHSGGERDSQRRQIIVALAQNDCGQQYRAQVAATEPRGFFERLFGGIPIFGNNPTIVNPDNPNANPVLPEANSSSTYRTLCVRSCDGFYFPISYSATQSKFRDDERTCQRTCPAAEVTLYVHRNPGEDVNQAVSISGQPYTALPNAFVYRKELVAGCGCRRPGESWAQALRNVDGRSTLESGDIVVDEQRAKLMSQPRLMDAQGRPIKVDPRANAEAVGSPRAGEPAATGSAAEGSEQPDPKRTVRSVGPTFLPGR